MTWPRLAKQRASSSRRRSLGPRHRRRRRYDLEPRYEMCSCRGACQCSHTATRASVIVKRTARAFATKHTRRVLMLSWMILFRVYARPPARSATKSGDVGYLWQDTDGRGCVDFNIDLSPQLSASLTCPPLPPSPPFPPPYPPGEGAWQVKLRSTNFCCSGASWMHTVSPSHHIMPILSLMEL